MNPGEPGFFLLFAEAYQSICRFSEGKLENSLHVCPLLK